MGKRKREDNMQKSEEKHRVLKEKLKELEQHHYWDYSSKLRALCLINRSPRKLMSSLQTRHSRPLSSDEEEKSLSSKACSVCSDCFENEEHDEEEERSVVVSSGSVHSGTCYNEDNDDGIDKFFEEEKEVEIMKGPGEMMNGSSTSVKNAGKIRNVCWEFCVLVIVVVLIVGIVIAVMFSVDATWYVDQDLDQVFLPPT